MTFSWSRLLDKKGCRVKSLKPIRDLALDLDKHREATLFDGLMCVGRMRVLEIEIHAGGIFLKGLEESTSSRAHYQEWFLRYEEAVQPRAVQPHNEHE